MKTNFKLRVPFKGLKQGFSSERLKLVSFYSRYLMERKSMLIMLSTLLLITLLVPIVVLALASPAGVISFSLYLYLPLMFANVVLPTFMAWLLFAKAPQEGVTLFVLSRKIKRGTDYLSKLGTIFALCLIYSFISVFVLTIIKVSFNVQDENVAAAFFLLLIVAFLQIGFFSSLMSLIALSFNFLASTSVLAALSVVFIVSPIIANFAINPKVNTLNWAPSANQVNYAYAYQADARGITGDAALITYIDEAQSATSRLQNNSVKSDYNLTPSNGAGIIFDAFVTTPFRALLKPATKPSAQTLTTTISNYQHAIYRVNDLTISSASSLQTSPLSLNTTNFVYAAQDANLINSTFDDVLAAFVRQLDLIKNNAIYANNALLNNAELLNNWITSLSSNGQQAWEPQNFAPGSVEGNALRFFLGISPREPLVYYLMRDHQLLNTKFNAIKEALVTRGFSAPLINAVNFFLTSENVHNNVFATNKLFTTDALNNYYPNAKIFNELKRGDDYDLKRIQALVGQISSSASVVTGLSVQLSDQTISYSNIDGAGFPFNREGIYSKADWDLYVQSSNQLGSLRTIYAQLNNWITSVQPSARLRQVTFSPNDLSISAYRDVKALAIANDEVATPLFMLILVILTFSFLVGGNKIYCRILFR